MLGFHHCRLIALQQLELISTLKRYLNALVIPSPKMPIDNVYDFRTEKAIKDFKMLVNRSMGRKIMVEDGSINYSLWKYINQELTRSQARLPWYLPEFERIKTSGELRPLYYLLIGIENSEYTEAMRSCDKKLAELFGGEGAVVMSTFEPSDLRKKTGAKDILLAGKPRAYGHNAVPCNELVGTYDRGGIIHVYMNEQGLPNDDGYPVGAYVPVGFKQIYEVKSGKQTVKLTLGINNTQYFYNETLKLYAVFAHVETSKVKGVGEKKANGSVKIGNIGGPGGSSEGAYVHIHIAFYSEFFGNHTTGTRVDPRDYFCK